MGGGGGSGARQKSAKEKRSKKSKREGVKGLVPGFQTKSKGGKREDAAASDVHEDSRTRGLRRRARGRHTGAHQRRRVGGVPAGAFSRRRTRPTFERFARRLGEERGSARAVRVGDPDPAAARRRGGVGFGLNRARAGVRRGEVRSGAVGAHVAVGGAEPRPAVPAQAEALRTRNGARRLGRSRSRPPRRESRVGRRTNGSGTSTRRRRGSSTSARRRRPISRRAARVPPRCLESF